MMQISWIDDSDEVVKVEVCPRVQIREYARGNKSGKNNTYLVWWEDPKKAKIIVESIKFPDHKFDQPRSLIFNGEGEFVREIFQIVS